LYIHNKNKYLYSEYDEGSFSRGEEYSMPANHKRWLTAQQTALQLNSTSAEICRLISIGRLSGLKEKQPGRPGKAQWLVSPASIKRETHLQAMLRARRRRRDKGASLSRNSQVASGSRAARHKQSASAE
jgi:hypothetical protein